MTCTTMCCLQGMKFRLDRDDSGKSEQTNACYEGNLLGSPIVTKVGKARHATRPCLSGFGAGLLGGAPVPALPKCLSCTCTPTHLQQLKQQGPLPKA